MRAPAEAQAGTFMHELGHNLDLDHGGADGERQKPKYLSIMNNDFFQIRGLLIDGKTGEIGGDVGSGASRRYHFDYSREALPGWAGHVLDENALDESAGLQGHVANKMLYLTWKPVGPGSHYNVYRRADGGGEVRIGTTTEYKDRDVVAGVVYTYTVRAFDPVHETESAPAEAVSLQLRK